MANLTPDESGVVTSDESGVVTSSAQHGRRAALATWGVGLCLALVACLGIHAFSTRSAATALEGRIASLERETAARLASEIQALRTQDASLSSDVAAVSARVDTATEDLNSTRRLAETMKRSYDRTARSVAENAAEVKSTREQALSQVGDVDRKVDGVSAAVETVATGLATTRSDLTQSQQDAAQRAAGLSERIATNATELSVLRRKGERDFFEFDIRKAAEGGTARAGDVRVQLTKADARRAKYDVVLHVDDRRLERKDLVMNSPVPFLVGEDRLRYELVVNAVDRDRIRGYVSVPKDASLAAERTGAE
jgi:predicted  nucleic acid-binding Zn-ribbon protein